MSRTDQTKGDNQSEKTHTAHAFLAAINDLLQLLQRKHPKRTEASSVETSISINCQQKRKKKKKRDTYVI